MMETSTIPKNSEVDEEAGVALQGLQGLRVDDGKMRTMCVGLIRSVGGQGRQRKRDQVGLLDSRSNWGSWTRLSGASGAITPRERGVEPLILITLVINSSGWF
jgi:hypothetical protein